ncbi:MAG TPA: tetratricopeptide repeat protein [Chitinophagaceae bacterium]|nr:tetratricopeptide repeat protein [Chitinophagaceae bacterium]
MVHTKINGFALGMVILLAGCNQKKQDSPFEKLLSGPPYRALSDSIRKEPRRDELYFRRAVLLNQNDHVEPALADFRTAWYLNPRENYALGVATILLEKNADSAIVFLRQALTRLPRSFLLRLSLARACVMRNQSGEALRIAEELLLENPQQVDVLKMKADLLGKMGRPREAISTLESAYALAPQDLELNYLLALKYAEAANPRVLQLADSMIRHGARQIRGEPHYYKGIYYANSNNPARAIAEFDEAIRKDYYLLEAYIEKGAIFYEQRRYREAQGVFQLANTISPAFPDAYYWLARCQEALGQKQEAILNYRRAYGLDKTFTKAKEAADRLAGAP